MSLGIHILGPGYGESILLELPDGTLGIVDVFRGGTGHSPVADFIRNHLARSAASFLAITHPHADHCHGVMDLVDTLAIEKFWIFEAFQEVDLFNYLKAWLSHPDSVEKELGLPAGTVAEELGRLNKHLLRENKQAKVKLLHVSPEFLLCQGQVSVRFLTPGDSQLIEYKRQLSAAITKRGAAHGGWTSPAKHNLASGALLLGYGLTRILLMADAELPLWQEWIANASEPLPTVQLIKVAHHGSLNGYASKIYEAVCDPDTTVGVLTPFNRQASPLPSLEGVRALRPHLARLFCTNGDAASSSSGLAWEAVPPRDLPALPLRWLRALDKDPALKRLLRPDLAGEDLSTGPLPQSPQIFIEDCGARPALLQLLNSQARSLVMARLHPGTSLLDEFRVSFYFDDQGREDESRRYVGWGAGELKAAPGMAV